MNDSYYGWENKEMWILNLWLNGDPAHYACFDGIIGESEPNETKAIKLRETLRLRLNTLIATDGGMILDLLHVVFERVCWLEIVDYWLN